MEEPLVRVYVPGENVHALSGQVLEGAVAASEAFVDVAEKVV
jgi:hypothetical protein